MSDVPLADFVDFSRDWVHPNIRVNWPALEPVGISKLTLVSIEGRDVPGVEALTAVFRGIGRGGNSTEIAYAGGSLWISTPFELRIQERLRRRRAGQQLSDQLARRLGTRVAKIEIDAGLADAFNQIGRSAGVSIRCDDAALHRADVGDPVAIRLSDVTWGEALDAVLAGLVGQRGRLSYVCDGGDLRVVAAMPSDPQLDWRFFAGEWPVSTEVENRVADLVAMLDAADYKVRQAAESEIQSIGPPATAVLFRLDSSKLTVAQNVVRDQILAHDLPPPAESQRMRRNVDFLCDCLNSDDATVRRLSREVICKEFAAAPDYVANSEPLGRWQATERLRRSLAGRGTGS